MALATEFVLRFLYDAPVRRQDARDVGQKTLDRRLKLMLFGLVFSSIGLSLEPALLQSACSQNLQVCLPHSRAGGRMGRHYQLHGALLR